MAVTRLLGRHVQEDVATSANAYAFAGADSEVIQQSKYVSGSLLVVKGL
jgi:hypothetical protein